MSLSVVLQKLAPQTRKEKRERFVSFLEDAMPRYGIDTPKRQAAFLATCCFESAYFRTTKEYRATSGRAKVLQDKYWLTGYYGRGLIQLTHKANYEAFSEAMAQRHGTALMMFVAVPERVAEDKWAVESACWFWQTHGLNERADRGEFFQIQGVVNRGSATKKALDYEDREKLYETALKVLSPAPQAQPSEAESLVNNPTDSKDTEQNLNAGESLLDRVSAPFIAVKGKFDQLGVEPGTVSRSSAFTTILTKVGGWLMLALGFVSDNALWFVVGGLLVIGALWYFSKAKDRANERRIA